MQRARENNTRAVIAAITGGVVICTIALQLRGFAFSADPSLCASIDTIGAFLTFTFTANALVRFRGTRDMMSLVLAIGFGVVGLMQLALALHLFHNLDSAVRLLDSLRPFWLQSNMLLAEAMLLASALERPYPQSADIPRKTFALMALDRYRSLCGWRPFYTALFPAAGSLAFGPDHATAAVTACFAISAGRCCHLVGVSKRLPPGSTNRWRSRHG